MKYCVDFDDFCDDTVLELAAIRKFKVAQPGFRVTLFAIPDRCSTATIQAAKDMDAKYGGSWLQLAPHGWRHSRFECLAWTDEELVDKVGLAQEKGINAPVFRPPGWVCDEQVYLGCKAAGYVLASHKNHRCDVPGVKEYVYNDLGKEIQAIHGHLTDTPYVDNYIHKFKEMPEGEFLWPQEVVE